MYLKEILEIPLDKEHEIIKLYEKILNGKERRFPNGIWEKPDAYFWAKLLVRYVFEEKLNLTVEELKNLNFRKTMLHFKLSGMYQKVFNFSPFSIVKMIYGDLFHEWEMKQVPMGFWQNKDNRIRAVKWLVEEKLQARTDEEIRKKLRVRKVKEYGLSSILINIHQDDLYAFFNEAYPNRMKRWELRQVGHHFWKDDENVKEALIWLMEKLNVDKKWLKENINYTLLKKYHLAGLIHEYDYDYEKLINAFNKDNSK